MSWRRGRFERTAYYISPESAIILAECRHCGWITWVVLDWGETLEDLKEKMRRHIERHVRRGTLPKSALKDVEAHFRVLRIAPLYPKTIKEIAEIKELMDYRLAQAREALKKGEKELASEFYEEYKKLKEKIDKILEAKASYITTVAEGVVHVVTPATYEEFLETIRSSPNTFWTIARAIIRNAYARRGEISIEELGKFLEKQMKKAEEKMREEES